MKLTTVQQERIFQLQRAQRVGTSSEVVTATLKNGEQKAIFENGTPELDNAVIIGIVVILPRETGELSQKAKTLLTASQISPARLKLSHENKDTFNAPLKMFSTVEKNLVYVPIEPLTNLNLKDSFVYFPENMTYEGVIELFLITA